MIGSFATSQALAAMTTALGAAPKMALTYVDSAQPLSNFLASGQYEAGQFATNYGPNTIPLLGLPMAGAGENADVDFKAIASGSQDSMINGVLQAFADKGYKNFVLRPGFEMNGGWFSWTVTEANAADFKAAFQRIATLAHNFQGATVSVDFNPNVGPSIPLQDYYPGNAYVDSIGLDIYGQPWTSDTSPTDTNGSPTNITLNYLMQFAKDNGKPFALPETGAGTADTVFPQQLVKAIQAANMPIAFAGLWDSNAVNNAQWTDNAAATAAWVAFANLVKNPPAGSASSAAITDASGNKWTITSGGQVAINGTVDAVTSNVIELAYVNGKIWQENSAKMWWGETKPDGSWANTPGTAASPLPVTTPVSSTLTLNMSEDAYLGDAQFTVSVDGTPVGGTMTASVLHASGDANVFVLTGNWAATAAHQIAISFINDAYGGAGLDRNLYVNSIAFNGTTGTGTAATMDSNGTKTVAVGGATAAAAPADTITLSLSEDAYLGNAQFSLSIDGKPVTTPQAVTALHSAAAWQAFSFSGNLGAGGHTVGITFGNDAYGGSPSLDRNLYANGIAVNGQHYGSGVSALTSNSTVNFAIVTTH